MAAPEAEHRDPSRPDDPLDDLETRHGEAGDVEHPADADAQADDEPLTPFYSVSGRTGAQVRVTAGWLNAAGEVQSLPIDISVGVEQAGAAQQLALAWYQRMLTLLYRAENDGEDE